MLFMYEEYTNIQNTGEGATRYIGMVFVEAYKINAQFNLIILQYPTEMS